MPALDSNCYFPGPLDWTITHGTDPLSGLVDFQLVLRNHQGAQPLCLSGLSCADLEALRGTINGALQDADPRTDAESRLERFSQADLSRPAVVNGVETF